MKVLWLCNIVPPAVAKQLDIDTTVKEGWITGTLTRLAKNNEKNISFGICMPRNNMEKTLDKKTVQIENLYVECYLFRENTNIPWEYDNTLENTFKEIIADFNPDIVHCFGTEYPHTLACAKALSDPDKLLISMQGVMEDYANDYCKGLPQRVIKGTTFRDFIKRDNIEKQHRKFELRAKMETQAIELTGNIAGRTQFDKNAVFRVNDRLTYHHLFETLRPDFYEGQWDNERLNDHTLFVSQCDYPIKGFHVLLEALPYIIKEFPDTKIYIAGNGITGYDTLKQKLKIGTYGRYCRKLMKKHNLLDKISVLGMLDAQAMKRYFMTSSVYVCPSILENSPNSMGEAMLIGIPVVASRSGGVPSMVEDEKEALLFNQADSISLAKQVIRLFTDADLAESLSQASKARGLINHNPDKNYEQLLEIYENISSSKEN